MEILIAAADPNTQPGWGKMIALMVAVGIFWVFVQVHKRVKRVKDGDEINPFSSNEVEAPQNAKAQASTPTGKTGTGPGKGVRKWFRKG